MVISLRYNSIIQSRDGSTASSALPTPPENPTIMSSSVNNISVASVNKCSCSSLCPDKLHDFNLATKSQPLTKYYKHSSRLNLVQIFSTFFTISMHPGLIFVELSGAAFFII